MEMTIGKLAKESGCSVLTIRFYEKEGIFSCSGRTEGNFRLYSKTNTEKLLFIRRCRSLGITIQEIKSLLTWQEQEGKTCESVNSLLDKHIGELHAQIQSLQNLEKDLIQLRKKCVNVHSVASCGIIEDLKV